MKMYFLAYLYLRFEKLIAQVVFPSNQPSSKSFFRLTVTQRYDTTKSEHLTAALQVEFRIKDRVAYGLRRGSVQIVCVQRAISARTIRRGARITNAFAALSKPVRVRSSFGLPNAHRGRCMRAARADQRSSVNTLIAHSSVTREGSRSRWFGREIRSLKIRIHKYICILRIVCSVSQR